MTDALAAAGPGPAEKDAPSDSVGVRGSDQRSMPGRAVQDVLAAWREAERELAAESDPEARVQAEARVESLRAKYKRMTGQD
jgi:hypothetical protein